MGKCFRFFRFFAHLGLTSFFVVSLQTSGSHSRTGVHPAERWVNRSREMHSLAFEMNKGQFDSRFEFAARDARHGVFVSPVEIKMQLGTFPDQKADTIAIALRGADSGAELRGTRALPGEVNYFYGPSRNWIAHVPTYERVVAEDVYPGVDAAYYGN